MVPWSTDRWFTPDWVEREPCKSALDPSGVDPGEFLYEEFPSLTKYR